MMTTTSTVEELSYDRGYLTQGREAQSIHDQLFQAIQQLPYKWVVLNSDCAQCTVEGNYGRWCNRERVVYVIAWQKSKIWTEGILYGYRSMFWRTLRHYKHAVCEKCKRHLGNVLAWRRRPRFEIVHNVWEMEAVETLIDGFSLRLEHTLPRMRRWTMHKRPRNFVKTISDLEANIRSGKAQVLEVSETTDDEAQTDYMVGVDFDMSVGPQFIPLMEMEMKEKNESLDDEDDGDDSDDGDDGGDGDDEAPTRKITVKRKALKKKKKVIGEEEAEEISLNH
ncbi:hypothetical protein QYF36_003607 [Acer negundo]|nr:hypothetical protein QYF36_003607 [Acer negundo]